MISQDLISNNKNSGLCLGLDSIKVMGCKCGI